MSFAKLTNSSRHIALVDCNNFYVSCERVFRPDWAHRPVGVLSNNDGCLVSRSEELKAAGIAMGVPYFKQRAALQAMGAIIVSSNYALYGDMSNRVMATLEQFASEVEVYSIDEAWMDLSGCSDVERYAQNIASTVLQYTGIPVSIGIGPTKVLAKLANRICKQHTPSQRVFHFVDDRLLSSTPVENVWGIGQRWATRLKAMGIQTALDLRDADEQIMRDRYGVVMQRLILELRGVACLGFKAIAPRKQIIVSRSFGQRVTDLETLLQAITAHATRAGEKLRAQSSVCGAIQVTLRSSHFNGQEDFFRQFALMQFAIATADTRPLIRAACDGIRKIYQSGPRYAKAGVMLLDLSPAITQQQHLFAQADDARSQRLMQTIDHINHRHGRHALFWGREGTTRSWWMRQEHRTPAFTTKWGELPVVH